MSGALIVIDQIQGGPVSPGTPGVSRDDMWLLGQVHVISASVNASYDWELLDVPPGSTATLDTPNAQTCHFTPDLYGTYLIRLITNGGGPGNVQVLAVIVRFDAAGVLANRAWRIPGLGETTEENVGGNVRGWDRAIRFILEDLMAQGTFRDASYGAAPGDTWVWSGASWQPGPGGGAIALTGDVEQGPPNVQVTRLNYARLRTRGTALEESRVLTVVPDGTAPTRTKLSPTDAAIRVLREGCADLISFQGDPGDRPEGQAGYRFPQGTALNGFAETPTKVFGSSPFVLNDGPGIPGGLHRLDKATEVLEAYVDFTLDGWTGLSMVLYEPVSLSIWVAEQGGSGFARVDPTTMVRTLVVLPGAGDILDLFEGNGFVYATDDAGQVFQIDPTGNVVTTGTPGTGSIYGGAVAAGRVWVVEYQTGTLFRLFEAGLAVDASVAGWTGPLKARYQAGSAVPPAPERVYVLDENTKTLVPAENPMGVMSYSTDVYVLPASSSPQEFDLLPGAFLGVVSDGLAGKVYQFGTRTIDGVAVATVNAGGVVDWLPIPFPTTPDQFEFIAVAANTTVPAWRTTPSLQVMSVDSSGGPITIEAPVQVGPAAPATFLVKDQTGDAGINPITVQDTVNGYSFDGSPTFILGSPRQSIQFVFNTVANEWSIL